MLYRFEYSYGPSAMRAFSAVAIFALFLASPFRVPAHAAGEGCAAAAWSLEADGAQLGAADLAHVPSGRLLEQPLPLAFALDLAPSERAGLPVAPERTGEGGAAGYVRLPAPTADGLLQVTLDQPAWIDLIASGMPLKAAAFTGVRDCPLARKSVRFAVATGAPLVLQISGTQAASVKLSISLLPAIK
ncbi:hypothetical protein [Azorhizobium caulinodans]|uniref:hypothetical protein n=1 Tax=Azorhizobium caulinodans TaxID=7 RepID=UPI002FBE8B6C